MECHMVSLALEEFPCYQFRASYSRLGLNSDFALVADDDLHLDTMNI